MNDPADQPAARSSRLAWLDDWMARHPWHPRFLPFMVYIAFIPLIDFGRSWADWLYPVLYTVQCSLVLWLLWRYRRLLPELNVRFHWLAVPVGVAVVIAWIALGLMMVQLAPGWFGGDGEPHFFQTMLRDAPAIAWLSLGLRLLGMSIVVPLFEELFIRSLCLRSFHRRDRTMYGLGQLLVDMPVVGEWLEETRWGKRHAAGEPVFGPEFERTPLGALSVFGVAASTFIFMIHHATRDWPGTIVCGIAYCLLLWWTNRRAAAGKLGLGPVVWAHGITNALLWAWTLWTNDWRFL